MNTYVPYGVYWSTPYARWQGSLAHLHSLEFAAHVAKSELARRAIPASVFDYGVFGNTVPQFRSFQGFNWVMAMACNPDVAGPTINQACATSARILSVADQEIRDNRASCALVIAGDRTSNGPHVYYPNPEGPGAKGRAEDWVQDNFMDDPYARVAMVNTAENVARRYQIPTARQHEIVLRRYQQYAEACADGHAFHRRYMTLPFAVPDMKYARTRTTLDGDAGVHDTTAEGLARLLLGVLSATQARLPVAALTEPALWVVLFSAMTAVAALRSRLGRYFDTAMTGMVAFILFVYLLVVCGYVAQILGGVREPDFRMLFVNFSHLRFFNDFQSWTLPLAMLPLLYAEQRGWALLKWLSALAAANWWLLMFLTGGRWVFLATATSTLFVALLFKGRIAHWLKWYGLSAVGGVVLYLVITQVAPAVITLSRSSLSGREDLWWLALSMIADHPLLGVGPMHYACVDPVLAGHPHNAVLQIAAEWGLPAALLLAALLLWLFYRAIVQTRRSSPVSGAGDVAPILR